MKFFVAIIVMILPVFSQKTIEGPMTGNDGKTYKTVKIGNQVWMAENLNETKYRNGDDISKITEKSQEIRFGTGVYCVYGYDKKYANAFGYLYSWFAVTDSRNIAPPGWHVPTDAEWQTLLYFLGGDSIAGGKLKEAGKSNWKSPNTGADNESGFSALPGGCRFDYDGCFYDLSSNACFWSATGYGESFAWSWSLRHDDSQLYRSNDYKQDCLSVRLVRDN